MGARIAFAVLLSTGLAACAANDRPSPSSLASNDARCAEIATTGDMYNYCLKVGPARAILDPEVFRRHPGGILA